jgi:hypothetical protein
MSTLRQHLSHRYLHAGCGVAALLVIAAIVFEIAPLAILGGLFCAAMMIGMVWMMLGMATRGHS